MAGPVKQFPYLDLVRSIQLSPVLVVVRAEFYSGLKPRKRRANFSPTFTVPLLWVNEPVLQGVGV